MRQLPKQIHTFWPDKIKWTQKYNKSKDGAILSTALHLSGRCYPKGRNWSNAIFFDGI